MAKFPCWMTPTLPEASMSRRLLSIFLLVSLALNAGIVGGLVVMGLFRKQHDLHHYQNFPEGPGAGEEARFNPRDFENENTKALRDSFRVSKRELMRELAKGKINETRIQGIIERSITLQIRLERTLGESTLRLRKSMTPQEARDYFGRRAERMDRFIDRNQRNNPRRKPNE